MDADFLVREINDLLTVEPPLNIGLMIGYLGAGMMTISSERGRAVKAELDSSGYVRVYSADGTRDVYDPANIHAVGSVRSEASGAHRTGEFL